MARGATVKGIEEAISRLQAERAAFNARIDGRIEGLMEALRIEKGESAPVEQAVVLKRKRRGDLKETVLTLATEMADKGMTADECVALAKDTKGIDLIPGSVSSLLSRLKQLDILFFDGERYRLKQYAGPRQAAA